MCRQINISTAQNTMTVLMYLYSRLHMHRTVHGNIERFDSVWQGELRLKVCTSAFHRLFLGIGWTKKAQLGLKNREFNSLSNETGFSLFCVLQVMPLPIGTLCLA
jgi:hypothetical protein